MGSDSLAVQSDDSYHCIIFRRLADGAEAKGTVGWREGAENRVVLSVWDGPSFAAVGADLRGAFTGALAGMNDLGFLPLVAGAMPHPPVEAHALFEPIGADDFQSSTTSLADETGAASFRLEPVLWLAIAAIMLAVLLPALARAEIPLPGKSIPFPKAPYVWSYEGPDFITRMGNEHAAARLRAEGADVGRLTPRIVVRHSDSDEVVARYVLEDGSFCDYEDNNCELDGIFPIVLAGAPKEPVLGAVTRLGARGQRLSVFRPLTDNAKPVFEATADYALFLKMMPDGLVVELEQEARNAQISREHRMWIAGDAGRCQAIKHDRLKDPPVPTREAAALQNELLRIARERSLDGFLALLSEDVLVSSEGSRGKQEFLNALDRGHETNGQISFWKALDRLLVQGGWSESAEPQTMTWPWLSRAWHEADDGRDAFIAGPDITLRAGPDRGAPILAQLPFGALRLAAPDGDKEVANWKAFGWLPVTAPGHCLGYVRAAEAAPLLGPRMVARHDGQNWLIEAFILGD